MVALRHREIIAHEFWRLSNPVVVGSIPAAPAIENSCQLPAMHTAAALSSVDFPDDCMRISYIPGS
jgi:hypothetical protein